MPTDCARQHHFFQVCALLHQIIQFVTVRNARHVLLDDRAIIQYFCYVMAGCADQFDAALEGINKLKKLVPIWKKEYFVDGEVWVDGEWDESLTSKR